MKVVMVTHLLHPGLVYSFTLPMDRKHYVRFYIWESKKAMQAGNSNNFNSDNDYLGSATGNYWGQVGKKIHIPKRFGEIHLIKGILGVGIVSHEIYHLVIYWADAHGWMPIVKDEQLALLCGNLNRRFWNEIYRKGLA
jgi:hypothetical protein